MKYYGVLMTVLFSSTVLIAGSGDDWVVSMQNALPETVSVEPEKARRAWVFSSSPGYKHEVIPYVNKVFTALSDKTKVCEIVISDDVSLFEPNHLKTFDAIIFNNTCSHGKERHLFRDLLIHQAQKYGGAYAKLSEQERLAKATAFEENVLGFVEGGGGLMVVHGGIAMMNDSPQFSAMIGGSFDYHPKYQSITVEPVEPGHPLLKSFAGKPFVHHNEPYVFKGAYADKNFRPLLKMDTSKLVGAKSTIHDDVRYMAWIRAHKKGRVFYVAGSHGKDSYTRPELLQFYLDGLQYVLGDLKCDDSKPSRP